ncbi:MAG TPA: ATP-binding protein [Anaerolineales bacterium]|nr:ATP-binding protein [Anaerolineales bacterium]
MEVIATLNLHTGLEDLRTIRKFLETELTARHINPDTVYDVVFSVNEITTNVLVHGYPNEEGWLEVEIARKNHDLHITIRDRAPAFDPTNLPTPDISLPLEQRSLGGLGVYLVKELMDQVSYQLIEAGGNELTLVKKSVF